MKKYLSFVLLSLLALPVLAHGTYPLLQINTAALQQAAEKAKPASSGASERGVVKILLNVEAQFDEEYALPNDLQKSCTAVRIAPNYLLASLACRGVAKTAIQVQNQGYPVEVEMPVAYRQTTSIFIGNHEIKTFKEDAASKLLLIKVDEDNEFIWFKDLPITNLFVAKDPNSLVDLFDEVIVNREKAMWFGRTCATTDITSVCSGSSCFSVCWKFHSAKTGDPIFGLSNKKPMQEFLLGFNDAEPKGEQRTEGRQYRFLSQDSLNFLQKNMDKAAWRKLQKKTVDENFFK